MNINLIRAEEKHLSALARMEKECFTNPWSSTQLLLELKNEHSFVLLAEKDGEFLGFVILRTLLDEGEIFNIAVCRNARQLGIGGALLQAAIQHAEAENVENIFLEVLASNGPAIALYKKYGFEPVGLRKKYYDNPTEDARIMVRRSETRGETEHAHTLD